MDLLHIKPLMNLKLISSTASHQFSCSFLCLLYWLWFTPSLHGSPLPYASVPRESSWLCAQWHRGETCCRPHNSPSRSAVRLHRYQYDHVSANTDCWLSNGAGGTRASPSISTCFFSMELNPPIVSFPSPTIDPFRSTMNTSSVNPFFMTNPPSSLYRFYGRSPLQYREEGGHILSIQKSTRRPSWSKSSPPLSWVS